MGHSTLFKLVLPSIWFLKYIQTNIYQNPYLNLIVYQEKVKFGGCPFCNLYKCRRHQYAGALPITAETYFLTFELLLPAGQARRPVAPRNELRKWREMLGRHSRTACATFRKCRLRCRGITQLRLVAALRGAAVRSGPDTILLEKHARELALDLYVTTHPGTSVIVLLQHVFSFNTERLHYDESWRNNIANLSELWLY